MTIMPASGIAMGYFGGKGLPFFTTTIPGIVKTDDNKKTTGMIAKNSFFVHKQRYTRHPCAPLMFSVQRPVSSATHAAPSVCLT